MKYEKILSKTKLQHGKYILTPIRKQDIQKIRKWRNDQMDILRQNKILTKLEQEDYFNKIIKRTFQENKPNCILFSFLLNDECIGYGGFVHIDWFLKRSEISFLNETNRAQNQETYKTDYSIFLKIILQIAFEQLCLNRIFTETFAFRKNTSKLLEKFGFRLEGRLKNHVMVKGNYFDSLIHGFLKQYYKKL